MARVPITVLGYQCERCGHQWIPRRAGNSAVDPRICPSCNSASWNRAKEPRMGYEEFRGMVAKALGDAGRALSWREVRVLAKLPQMFPNTQWIHRLEKDIRMERIRSADGVVRWRLQGGIDAKPRELEIAQGAPSHPTLISKQSPLSVRRTERRAADVLIRSPKPA
jgi:hypothetical protein